MHAKLFSTRDRRRLFIIEKIELLEEIIKQNNEQKQKMAKIYVNC